MHSGVENAQPAGENMMRATSLLDRIAEHARGREDATAVISGDERVSYGELATMALTALREIRELDLPSGPVAVHAAKSPRTIALILACLHAGVPFLLPSVELGADTFATLLDRAGCRDLLVAEPPGPAGVGTNTHKIDTAVATPRPAAPRESPGGADDVSFMLTTSGSTGVPKIVPLTVGAVDRFTDWAAAQFHIGPDTAVLNYAPLNFDVCLLDVWATLKAGGTAVLVDADRSTNGRYLTDLVRTNEIGVIQAVPMLYRLLGDAWDGTPFTSVRHVVLTGDKISTRLLGELPAMFPAARIWNLYGCTETNDSLLHEIVEADGDVPVGRPIPGVDALVIDEDGAVLDGPASGELYVHTPFQTTGYLDPTGATFDRFVRLDGRPHRYFRSGDLVRRDADGVFILLGRNDFQVKVRGTRVNLEEIELAILDHEDVVEVAVVGLPDVVAGKRIHAVVRGVAPGKPNVLGLREHCRLRLPRVAIPAAIKVVQEPLPRTSTGKVDRQEICRSLQNRS
jgi:amino acid adenylation domain-containing protein